MSQPLCPKHSGEFGIINNGKRLQKGDNHHITNSDPASWPRHVSFVCGHVVNGRCTCGTKHRTNKHPECQAAIEAIQ